MTKPASPVDRIYVAPRDAQRFAFDAAVAEVFADMINRSVPGYQSILGMLGVFAARYARPHTVVYDLGCSLGASTLVLRHALPPATRIVAIDNAPAMVERCQANVLADDGQTPVSVCLADIVEVEFEPASVVVMNFTLQFIDPSEREPLLQKIHQALLPGGALIIAEKTREPDPAEENWLVEMHHAFKKANGYSELEIAQKRTALENVLQPDSVEAHRARLRSCGFGVARQWFQCLNFAALIAIK